MVCVLGLLSYAVAAAILHKLDQLDLRRAAVVPLCGQDGLFKYEIQVKTGWSRGAGELRRGTLMKWYKVDIRYLIEQFVFTVQHKY